MGSSTTCRSGAKLYRESVAPYTLTEWSLAASTCSQRRSRGSVVNASDSTTTRDLTRWWHGVREHLALSWSLCRIRRASTHQKNKTSPADHRDAAACGSSGLEASCLRVDELAQCPPLPGITMPQTADPTAKATSGRAFHAIREYQRSEAIKSLRTETRAMAFIASPDSPRGGVTQELTR